MTEEELSKQPQNQETPEESQFLEPENFDEEYQTGEGILTDVQYEIPENADAFVDMGDGRVVKKEDMQPFDIIKTIAKQNGTDIQNPKKSCKHCYGRGYEGIDSETRMPIPCRCLFRGRSDKEKANELLYDSNKLNHRISRLQKRQMARMLRRLVKNGNKTKRPNVDNNEEPKKPSIKKVTEVLKEYIKQNSFKKTAKSLQMTLTSVKKIVKSNKSKLEKMLKKENDK